MGRLSKLFWVAIVGFQALALWASDDKVDLYNTFYLEGDSISYVLIIRKGEKRTFDLYGPNNTQVSGTVRVSDEDITFTSGEVKRYLHWDIADGQNLKLGRRDNDKITRGSVLGGMPPVHNDRVVYLAERHWLKKGLPRFVPPVQPGTAPKPDTVVTPPPPTVAPPVVAPPPTVAPPPPATAPPVAGVGTFEDFVGAYKLGNETLKITKEGQFEYVRANGTRQEGVLMRADEDVSFISATHKRRLIVKAVANGLQLQRQDTDVVKAQDTLGAMPPQDRTAVVWLKSDAALPPAVQPPPVQPPPTVQPPAVQPPPVALPVVPAARLTAKELAGTYSNRVNAFIIETVVFKEDGAFTYKDSNGAEASGTLKLDNGILTLTAGEVVRELTALLEGNTLTLTCTANDKPKFKNDLASMSPTVLKTVKYVRK